MTLQRGLEAMEYLHATLFFAMLMPLICAAVEWSDSAGTGALYLKCLLIMVPIIVTERAAKRVRSVILYMGISVLLLAGVGGVSGLIALLTGGGGRFGGYEICYCIVMLLETFFVIVKRFADRVRAAKWEREEPLAAKRISFLEHPTLSLVWYFVVFYLIGLCLRAKLLCDIAFYSAIVYTFLALFYEYFGVTRAYLEMNRRTRGIPRRRLYGVGLSMLLVFSALLLIGMMPAVFLAGHRPYTDIWEWFANVHFVPYEYESAPEFQEPSAGGADWTELLNDGEPAPEPSKVVNVIMGAIGAVCLLAFAYGVILMIRQVLRDFRNSRDENGDIVEEIEDDPIARQREMIFGKKGRRGAKSEAERIRQKYRRTIRKHRKERPAPHESPAEIEEYAGLGNDEQMQQLHREYEKARYGKTEENLRISDE